ncbi:phiSA1p31-related protein [Streptomyces sp. DT224]|uniref:phiSA1p31-related protein n=1 Tax=Streptomyces sp. DT224 TaxID=3393426 RepID=UPI003CEED6BB
MSIRIVDMDEHVLVLTVTNDGRSTLEFPGLCGEGAAALLRELADRVEASHGPDACRHHAPPSMPAGGTLDTERRVWTDGSGHAWDLSITWRAVDGVEWRWTDRCSGDGVPVMRAGSGPTEQTLDVVWSLYGPLAPVAGERS